MARGKGGGGLALLLGLLVIGALVYAYVNGVPDFFGGTQGQGTDAINGDRARQARDDLISQPWFYTAVGAGIFAALGIALWRRLAPGGRVLVAILVGIAIAFAFLGAR